MPVNFAPSANDLLRFAPEIILTVAGTILMVLDPLFAKRLPKLFGHLSILALLLAIAGAAGADSVRGSSFSNLLVVDGFATFFRYLVLVIGVLAVLASYRYLDLEKAETGEYHALVLFAIVGQCLMVAANDLIMIFIGLGFRRSQATSWPAICATISATTKRRSNTSCWALSRLRSCSTGWR